VTAEVLVVEQPRNSALFWLPRVERAGLPVPKTFVVPYDHASAIGALLGDVDEPGFPWGEIEQAIGELGGRAFIRTDQGSAKHSGPVAYRFDETSAGDDLRRLVSLLVEDQEMKFWLGPELPSAFLVREWLDLEAAFSAFGYAPGADDAPGHPIAREWRFFAEAGRGVLCAHPYWPADAIKFRPRRTGRLLPSGMFELTSGEPEGWREKLRELHRPIDMPLLEGLAVQAAEACPGVAWSVDFARLTDGSWRLIDMALAGHSWHPPCPLHPEKGQGDDES
jgi:hypothetical protein